MVTYVQYMALQYRRDSSKCTLIVARVLLDGAGMVKAKPLI